MIVIRSLGIQCRSADLNHVCDIESQSFFPQLFFSANEESSFCFRQVVKEGCPHTDNDFTFYQNVSIQITPVTRFSTNLQVKPTPT